MPRGGGGRAWRRALVLAVLAVLAAPGAVANMRSEHAALQTSLAAAGLTQKMQADYAASQQAEEQREEQYVQQQQQYAASEQQAYGGSAAPGAQALQEPAPAEEGYAPVEGYAEPGEVPAAAPAQPWPADPYNTGQPLVTTQTEEDARQEFPGKPIAELSHRHEIRMAALRKQLNEYGNTPRWQFVVSFLFMLLSVIGTCKRTVHVGVHADPPSPRRAASFPPLPLQTARSVGGTAFPKTFGVICVCVRTASPGDTGTAALSGS